MPSFDYKRVDLDKASSDVQSITDGVYAAMTLPGAFSIEKFDGKYSIDGGIVMYIDPEAAIKRCLEQVEDQKDIVIDMISLRHRSVIEGKRKPALNDELPDGWIEIARVMDQYPNVQYRYLITPSEDLVESVSKVLDWRSDKIK